MEFQRKVRSIEKIESDRLGYLPPELRTHIISFLPTKEALRLCALSTQWRHPCSSLPILYFNLCESGLCDKSYDKYKEDFKNCLDKILIHRTAHIQHFNLRVHVDDHKPITYSEINGWITVVLQHHVSKLTLCLFSKKPITLPLSLFACSTLRELSLFGIKLTATSSIRFPMVRKLVLWRVTFCGEHDDLGSKLLSPNIFPVLQSLQIFGCDHIHSLSISIPSFMHLMLSTCLKRPKFHLSIPTLQHFEYRVLRQYLSRIEFSADTVSSLNALTLHTIRPTERYPPIGYNVSTILSTMGKIETLHISDYTVECFSLDQSFATITRSLSFSLIRFSLDMYRTENHVQAITHLTGCFLLLQTLDICFTKGSVHQKEHVVGHLENTSQLSQNRGTTRLCHLREVKIRGFCASDCELELLSYLFSWAINLEEMTVRFENKINPQDRMAIDEKLKSLPKVSHKLKLVCR